MYTCTCHHFYLDITILVILVATGVLLMLRTLRYTFTLIIAWNAKGHYEALFVERHYLLVYSSLPGSHNSLFGKYSHWRGIWPCPSHKAL